MLQSKTHQNRECFRTHDTSSRLLCLLCRRLPVSTDPVEEVILGHRGQSFIVDLLRLLASWVHSEDDEVALRELGDEVSAIRVDGVFASLAVHGVESAGECDLDTGKGTGTTVGDGGLRAGPLCGSLAVVVLSGLRSLGLGLRLRVGVGACCGFRRAFETLVDWLRANMLVSHTFECS